MANDEPRPQILDEVADELGIRIPTLFEHTGNHPTCGMYRVEFCVDRGEVAIRSIRFGEDKLRLSADGQLGQDPANVARMPDAADVAALDWTAITRDAVLAEFVKAHMAQPPKPGEEDEWVAATQRLALAADAVAGVSYSAPGKNHRWSQEMAQRVTALNAAGGIEHVAATLNVTERSARRYVTRAQQEIYPA